MRARMMVAAVAVAAVVVAVFGAGSAEAVVPRGAGYVNVVPHG